jgi:hypothetical protein
MFGENFKKTIHNKIWKTFPQKCGDVWKRKWVLIAHRQYKSIACFFFSTTTQLPNQDVSGDDPLTRHILELPRHTKKFVPYYTHSYLVSSFSKWETTSSFKTCPARDKKVENKKVIHPKYTRGVYF